MQIRAVRPDEALIVARVHLQADEETYRPIFGPRFQLQSQGQFLQRWQAALAADDVFLASVDDGGAVVGFAHAHEDWMSALYVLAAHKRRGVGKALLRALCGAARARGVRELRFDCVADNANAIGFYEAQGARQVGRKQAGEGADAWDELIFALATDSPALRRA
jgi:ribosomal protein S18 acetylase RimI-like enzyme